MSIIRGPFRVGTPNEGGVRRALSRTSRRHSVLEGTPRHGVTKLTVIMPVYNEERTVLAAIEDVLSVRLPCPLEVIVVDDGSSDGTREALGAVEDERVIVHHHPVNLGKGTALRTGLNLASGSHVLPFDADLEYSARDIPSLVESVGAPGRPVVFGTRRRGVNSVYSSFRYAYGNRIMTTVANVLFDSDITDLHTCLKLVPVDILRELSLREGGFGQDTELTAGLLRRGIRPFEVPISYHGRTHDEGKKIGWRDAVVCMAVLGRVRMTKPSRRPAKPRVVIDLTEPALSTTVLDDELAAELNRPWSRSIGEG